MRIDGSGNVGIGDTSPDQRLHVNSGASNVVAKFESTDSIAAIQLKDNNGEAEIGAIGNDIGFYPAGAEKVRITSSGNVGINMSSPLSVASGYGALTVGGSTGGGIIFSNTSSGHGQVFANSSQLTVDAFSTRNLTFQTNGSERMRIDSSGTLLVGTTTGSGAGLEMSKVHGVRSTVTNNVSALFDRLSSDGDIALFRKDGSEVGSLGIQTSGFYIDGEPGHAGIRFGANTLSPRDDGADANNAINLGQTAYRFADIYATNGTINTSDRNEKQDIEALTDAETRVAVAAKGLLRKFKWKSAVEEKGDEARTHFGIIAQDLQDAFTAEGLDAGDYAMFISGTWTDDDGVEQTRLGVRYSELLAFIIAAI